MEQGRNLAQFRIQARVWFSKQTHNKIFQNKIPGCVTLTSSSIKVSGDTENMLFLLLACVIKAHLHTEKGAQGGKGKKGNPGKTLTWILSQETATPQRLISTHGEEQSGGTPKTSSEK